MPQIDKSWWFFCHQWTRGRFLQFSFSVTPNWEQSAQCFHAWVWVPNIMYINVCSCAGVVDAFPMYDNDLSPVVLTQSWHTAPPLQWRTSVLLGDIYILIGTFTQRESGQSNSRSTIIKKNQNMVVWGSSMLAMYCFCDFRWRPIIIRTTTTCGLFRDKTIMNVSRQVKFVEKEKTAL